MLNQHSKLSTDPPNSSIKLKKHQLALLEKIKELETKTNVICLCDSPGSGKSYVFLATVLWDITNEIKKTNLLIVPQNIFRQWSEYIKNSSNLIKVKACVEYADVINSIQSKEKFSKYDIVITTPLYYSVLCDILSSVNRIILDEVDSVEFFMNKTINYEKIWYISASFDPHTIGSSLKITDEITTNNMIKCEEQFIKDSFNIPDFVSYEFICYDPYVNMLENTELNIIKINAMDFTNEFKNIKKIVTNTKDFILYILKDKLITIDKLTEQIHINKKIEDRTAKLEENLTVLNLELLKTENFLKNMQERVSITNCPICMEDFNYVSKKIVLDCCKNCFCSVCVSNVMGKGKIIKCPMCREDTKLKDSTIICDVNEIENELEKIKLENEKMRIKKEENEKMRIQDDNLNKIERLEKILNELNKKDHKKILIFSQYTPIFSEVIKLLQKNNMKYSRFDDGSNMKKLNDIIDKYRNNEVDIILLDTSMYAAGLNLEMSTDVIFLHNTDKYNQVIGRAQRPGRTCSLNVYYLRYENELS